MLFISSSVPPPTHLRPHPTSLLALSSLLCDLPRVPCPAVSLFPFLLRYLPLSASLSLLTPSHVLSQLLSSGSLVLKVLFLGGNLTEEQHKSSEPPRDSVSVSLSRPYRIHQTNTHTHTHTPTQSTVRRGYRDNTHTHTHKLSVCVHV